MSGISLKRHTMNRYRGRGAAVFAVFLGIFILSIISIPVNGGYVWDKKEISALKYNMECPFIVSAKQTILYSSTEDGGSYYDIWKMDMGGKNHVQLTDNDIHEVFPTSDSKGEKIVFQAYDDDYYDPVFEIFTMSFGGSNLKNITDDDFKQTNPSISNDGKWIVFASDMDNTTEDLDIWMCDIDGIDFDQITDRNWNEYWPSFSHDNTKIAFVAEETQYDKDIHLIGSNGQGWERLLMDQNEDETEPIFTSDGNYILYRKGDYSAEAAVANIDTGETWELTADTIDENGYEISDNIEGYYIRFYPGRDSIPNNDIKLIYSAKEGMTSPDLSIWTAELQEASYMVEFGPIERDVASYDDIPMSGAKVFFTYKGTYYENTTDNDGITHFVLPVGELPSDVTVTASIGAERIEWNGDTYYLPDFSDDQVKIGPIKEEDYEDDWWGVNVEGAKVSFTIDGVYYENKTDYEGYAYFTVIQDGERLTELPYGTSIKAVHGGDTVKWNQGDSKIPKFDYEGGFWSFTEEYLTFCIIGGVVFFIIFANVIGAIVRSKKKKQTATRYNKQPAANASYNSTQLLFDNGRNSAMKGNDLFNRREFEQALRTYQTAQQNLEQAGQKAKYEGDAGLQNTIEGLLASIRDNMISAEMEVDKQNVQDGYSDAEKAFGEAVQQLQEERIFEARSQLMEISRNLEHLISVAKSRNFIQAIKNLTAFQVRVREKINKADMALTQGIDRVSATGGPSTGTGGAMAKDIELRAEKSYQGGYLVVEMTIRNNTFFDLDSAELKLHIDTHAMHLSHTNPQLPTTESSVSVGFIEKNSKKQMDLYFDPMVCTRTHVGASLIYMDQSYNYNTSSLDRMTIEIQPPKLISQETVNIATLQDIIATQAVYQDSKIYNIAPKLSIKEVLTLAKDGVDQTNLSKIRETRTRDMDSVWFYGGGSGAQDKIIVRVSVMKSNRTLEVFVACSKREHLITVLADISGKVLEILNNRWKQLQPVTQVNVEIKDSIIQRSNLDFGGAAGTGTGGGINIQDSVMTRSNVGAGDPNLGIYRNLLIFALADGVISNEEEEFLAAKRRELSISDEVHISLLTSLKK